MCIVDALGYIFVRNFMKQEVRRIVLSHSPVCMATGEPNKWKSNDDGAAAFSVKDAKKEPKQNYLIAVGTKEGKVLVYQVVGAAGLTPMKLFETRPGLAYGAITAIDVQPTGEYIVAGTETGEILQYELLKKMNEDNDDE